MQTQGAIMLDLIHENPWLLVIVLAAAVILGCTAIVFITAYLKSTHQAEIDAMLKREMVARGLTAADIKQILEARSDGEATRLALGDQGMRIGLGKLKVEMGSLRDQAKSQL